MVLDLTIVSNNHSIALPISLDKQVINVLLKQEGQYIYEKKYVFNLSNIQLWIESRRVAT